MDRTGYDCEIVFDRDIECVDPEGIEDGRSLVPRGMTRCPLSPICPRFGEFGDCSSPGPVIACLSLFFEFSRRGENGTEYVFSPYYHPDVFVVFSDGGVTLEWFDGRMESVGSVDELIGLLCRRQTVSKRGRL